MSVAQDAALYIRDLASLSVSASGDALVMSYSVCDHSLRSQADIQGFVTSSSLSPLLKSSRSEVDQIANNSLDHTIKCLEVYVLDWLVPLVHHKHAVGPKYLVSYILTAINPLCIFHC